MGVSRPRSRRCKSELACEVSRATGMPWSRTGNGSRSCDGPEMIEAFDGFGIVDPGLLPMGMVRELRSGRVNWQE